MKINYKFFVFLLIGPLFLNAAWKDWSHPMEINWGDTPSMSIDSNTGDVHMTLMSSGVHGVIYAKVDSAGQNLFKEAVPNAKKDLGEWHFGASVAVDPSGNPHIVFRNPYGPNPWVVWRYDILYTHKENGQWSNPLELSTDISRGYVTRIAIDDFERVHIVHSAKGEDSKDYAKYFRIYNDQIEFFQDSIGAESGNFIYRIDDHMTLNRSVNNDIHLVMGCPIYWEGGGTISYFKKASGLDSFHFGNYLKSPSTTHRNGGPDVFSDTLNTLHFCYGSHSDSEVKGRPSIRYVKYQNDQIVQSVPVTHANDLAWDNWEGEDGKGWGLGSIATSPDGKYIVIVSLSISHWEYDSGALYCYYSSDFGQNWQKSEILANESGGCEGRDMPVIKAYKNNFYLLYSDIQSQSKKVYLRIMEKVGDEPPNALLSATHSGFEGETIIFNASGSNDPGQNPGIVEYAWDWNGDHVYDYLTSSPELSHVYTDDYQGKVNLIITDRIGQKDTVSTQVIINNASPVIDIGAGKTVDEGDVLSFSVSVTDDGSSDTHTYLWDLGDGTSKSTPSFTYTYADENVYLVSCTVSDDDGGSDNASFNVTVKNVPPVVTINGQPIGDLNESLVYQALVTDPGINDQIVYAWDLDGDGVVDNNNSSLTLSYSKKGVHPISVEVDDGDGGIGRDSLIVVISDGSPVIIPIDNQTVEEGGLFQPVLLTNYVYDLVTASIDVGWQLSGAQELNARIQDHRLYVNSPFDEWFGFETLTLTAQNQQGLKDSIDVTFTVNYFNDPPQWTANIGNYSIPEDTTITITLDYLRDRVEDPDHDLYDLGFALDESTTFSWEVDTLNETFVIRPEKDWWGHAQVGFIVFDPGGKGDIDSSWIWVTNIPEPPVKFDLQYPMDYQEAGWPDTLSFQWGASYDPDNGDFVYYTWTLEKQNDGPLNLNRRTEILEDTLYKFPLDDKLSNGTYMWWVTAFDEDSASRQSTYTGIIAIGTVGLESEKIREIPETFQLLQNYPNPFNHKTQITYHLPRSCEVNCVIYNLMGQQIKTLRDGYHEPGIYHIGWDGTNMHQQIVESGLYILRFESKEFTFERKMMLLK